MRLVKPQFKLAVAGRRTVRGFAVRFHEVLKDLKQASYS